MAKRHFHAGNTGSNPVGDAKNIEGLAKTPLIFLVPPACQSRKSDTAKYALDVA